MGKNKSKRKPRTEFQKFESSIAKLDYKMSKEKALEAIRIAVKENEKGITKNEKG